MQRVAVINNYVDYKKIVDAGLKCMNYGREQGEYLKKTNQGFQSLWETKPVECKLCEVKPSFHGSTKAPTPEMCVLKLVR